ncbi:NADPH-dependent FMN reductase [Nocardia inohanensis]|uniref:NADPH-dependent FMN reductase n=1 Tax=Nocardia inohanensis TaxID=209246 RepID=UPI0008303338|nr:NAD(P)H-dependent oxidoreductase [Nocardia inohanensis]
MVTTPLRILLISGSTRDRSTNTAALRTISQLAPEGVEAPLYAGLRDLPQFVPGAEPEPPVVEALHKELAAADAVLICSPEYAGMIPGSLKNLLEWTVGAADLHEKPVAYVNVAFEGRGNEAVTTLRTVLGYVGAELVEAASGRITVLSDILDADGSVADPAARERLSAALDALIAHLRAV